MVTSDLEIFDEVADFNSIEPEMINSVATDQQLVHTSTCSNWLFETLGEFRVDDELLEESVNTALSKVESTPNDNKKEEAGSGKEAEEIERLQMLLYILVLTYRKEMNSMNDEIKRLKSKCNANQTVNCPQCKFVIDIRKSSIEPRYVKVIRGSKTVEVSFNNLDNLKDWLIINRLDEMDGLPVLNSAPSLAHETLASTGSLIVQKNATSSTRKNSPSHFNYNQKHNHSISRNIKHLTVRESRQMHANSSTHCRTDRKTNESHGKNRGSVSRVSALSSSTRTNIR